MVEEDILNMYSAIVAELRILPEVCFFAVVKMDDITERWSLLFGLKDANDLDKREKVFKSIRKIIENSLTLEERQNIARIGLFSTTEHIVEDFAKFDEGEIVENIKANGNFVHKGYILISR